ncbi:MULTISPECIES: outer membrane lipoprotein-sorting protein [Chromobacterium]|uniref:outer membrane lipoprotein-sorting protein n=1 Tax=Chromobacterium TaxID=535 RepID=UPI000ABB02B6|nr:MULTISPECIES: outer membrane lipoprotein-sorting protein [Chromobacterium]WSE90428.1 outer membrane lipoprotein-sorting protein [Chromobacterium subtsugae]WVH58800.1 outer membrane lipoprotein-sorting protein [Chromobacterium subtsugae]
MKNKWMAALALLAGLAQAAPDAQTILANSDAVRNPDKSFGLIVSLVSYKDGKENERSALAVYSRADPRSGQFRSLLRFVNPARDAGKLMLKNGNDLWFYDPASKASVPISPQQRLLGQASNGDVVTVNLALDYQAALAGEEDIQDGDRQTRHCYKLRLSARNPGVTYHAIELWVDTAGYRSRKARFFAESGGLLKTAYYRAYQPVLGQQRPTETVIIDGLNPKWVTVLRNSDFAWREVPEAWLQRDYLPRFRAE